MITLRCPVRGCEQALCWGEHDVQCAQRHRFDLGRSGYCNLLQPQDRRSVHAGDSKQAVQARRRTLQRGLGEALLQTLITISRERGANSVLDAGCGEGWFLSHLCDAIGVDGWGVDLSIAAVDAAARAHPNQHWLVANADRHLPFGDGDFDLVVSITGPKNASEFRRVLRPDGRLLLVVAGEDDLVELRQAVLGGVRSKNRIDRMMSMFGEHFELVGQTQVRSEHALDRAGLLDVLEGTYRGARHAQQDRVQQLNDMRVTAHYCVLDLEPRLGIVPMGTGR